MQRIRTVQDNSLEVNKMAKRQIIKIAILISTTLILTLLVSLTVVSANLGSWNMMTSGTTNDLSSVWGTAGTDIYAVGNSGTIRHFDGSNWKPLGGGITNDLKGVWGVDSGNVFVVGNAGTILRYNGSTWSLMSSGTTNDLNSIWGVDNGNVYAVGNAGTILRYNGSTWSSMSSGTTNDLNSIWGASGSKIFAAGNQGTILLFNGSTWSSMNSGTTNDLQSVWGAPNTDAFTAGESGTILRYSGSTWQSMSSFTTSDLRAIWGTTGDDIFAVGNSGTVAHYDGFKWNSMNRDTLIDLYTLWGTSSSDVFTAGKSGTILRYTPPAITSISPIEGDQGTTFNITLNGTNLTSVNDVRFGAGIAVNNFTAVNSNQITASITIVSDASLGTRNVSVYTPGGVFALPNSFTVKQALPALISVSPDQDKQGATVNVTITGTNLITTSTLQFGSGIAVNSFSALSSNQLAVNITLAADAAVGTRDVSVTTAGGSFTLPSSFTVKPAAPIITSVSPNQGNQEKTLDVIIEGTNLIGASEVKLGTGIIVNNFTALNSNQLTTNISLAADAAVGTRDCSVTTPGGSYILPNSFTVKQALPFISSINPVHGSQGATLNVTITGMNFDGVREVRFGADIAVHNFNVLNSKQLIASLTIVPSAALGTREVSVTTPGGSFALPNSYTVTQALPVITSVGPDEASPDTAVSVIISGSNFNEATAVSFGNGIIVQSFTNLSPTQLKVNLIIDKEANTGARDITVTTPGGSSVLGNGFMIKKSSLGTLMLALIWTGIGIIIILFIILNQLRQKKAAKL